MEGEHRRPPSPLFGFRAGETCAAPPSAGREVTALAYNVRNGRCRGAKRPRRESAVRSLLTRTTVACCRAGHAKTAPALRAPVALGRPWPEACAGAVLQPAALGSRRLDAAASVLTRQEISDRRDALVAARYARTLHHVCMHAFQPQSAADANLRRDPRCASFSCDLQPITARHASTGNQRNAFAARHTTRM